MQGDDLVTHLQCQGSKGQEEIGVKLKPGSRGKKPQIRVKALQGVKLLPGPRWTWKAEATRHAAALCPPQIGGVGWDWELRCPRGWLAKSAESRRRFARGISQWEWGSNFSFVELLVQTKWTKISSVGPARRR